MKKLTNAMIRHHLITIAVVFAAALTLAISAPASAQQYSGDQGSTFQDKDYDFNYREKTGGSRSSRYSPKDQESSSDREYDYNYDRAADDDYDWRYRENYGGSREGRYMPNGQRRGSEPGTYSRQGMGADDDYDWRYRERSGGSREQRYMPRGDQRQGQGEQEEWSFFDGEQDRRGQMTRRGYTGGSRDQRYSPRQESYDSTQRAYNYQSAGDRTGGSRDQRYTPRQESYDRTQRDYNYQSAGERTGGSRSQRFSPQQQARQQGQWKLTPEGWVRIGYDLDDDGNFDTYEYISYYDLKKARESSEQKMRAKKGQRDFSRAYFDTRQNQRKGRSQSQQQAGSGQGQDQGQGQEMSLSQSRQAGERWKFDRIQGTIKEMKSVDLTSMDEPHSVARMKLENGRMAKVDLGPQRKVEEYKLKTGDTLIIFGTSGRINDKPMLMAHWIEYDNRVVSIRRPQDKNMRRYKAEVVKTKETNVRDSGNLLMARVKFEDGRTTIVNLGPSDTLKAYNVKPGVKIDMLTRPVNIDGKRALVAEQLMIGDKVVDINWKKVKNLPKK